MNSIDPPEPVDHTPMLDSMLSQARARFDGLAKAAKLMTSIRGELDKLTSMGPSVTQDDVLDGMATLVGRGIDPKLLTSLISGNPQIGEPPMPQDSMALAGWLQHQDQVFAQQEAQFAPQLNLARHQMGVAAIHALVNNHVGSPPQVGPRQSAAVTPTNPLGGA